MAASILRFAKSNICVILVKVFFNQALLIALRVLYRKKGTG
ncbi:MAG: hypothetical protein ACLTQL_04290 [Eisenbergiella sp.]